MPVGAEQQIVQLTFDLTWIRLVVTLIVGLMSIVSPFLILCWKIKQWFESLNRSVGSNGEAIERIEDTMRSHAKEFRADARELRGGLRELEGRVGRLEG